LIISFWGNLKRAVKSLFIQDTWKQIDECDVLMIRDDIHCGYNFEGKAYAHLLDSLADYLKVAEIRCRTIASPYSILVGEKAYNSPISINKFFLKCALLKYLGLAFCGRKRAHAWDLKRKKVFFLNLFERTKVKFVVSIGVPDHLISACRECDIDLYQIQHGLISKNHGMVQHLQSIKHSGNIFPAGFLCWDEASANCFRELGIEKFKAWMIGNPWFLRFYFPKKTDCLVKQSEKEIEEIGFISNQRPNILVTLQYGLKKYFGEENNTMIEALRKVILETKDKYNWLLRMHPTAYQGVDKREQLDFLKSNFGGEENIEWEVSTRLSLPVLLKNVDLHITYNSSTVIEAAWFGVPSAVLFPLESDEFWSDLFENEIRTGIATVVPQTVEALVEWIDTNLTGKKKADVFKASIYQQKKGLDQFINFVKRTCINKD